MQASCISSVQCFKLIISSKTPSYNRHCTVTSLLPRGNSSFIAQYFKSNAFNGFCKQVSSLFSSVNVFYPNVIIKVTLPYQEVSHLNVFWTFVILHFWLIWWHLHCQYATVQNQATVLTAKLLLMCPAVFTFFRNFYRQSATSLFVVKKNTWWNFE